MHIETVADLADQLADWFGIYGSCKNEGCYDDRCTYDRAKPFCCRIGFMQGIQDRIENAVANDKRLEHLDLLEHKVQSGTAEPAIVQEFEFNVAVFEQADERYENSDEHFAFRNGCEYVRDKLQPQIDQLKKERDEILSRWKEQDGKVSRLLDYINITKQKDEVTHGKFFGENIARVLKLFRKKK